MTVVVLLEGTEAGVEGRAAAAKELLGDVVVGREAPAWFNRYPFASDEVGLKLTAEIGGLARLLLAVRRTTERHRVAVHVRGSAAGVLYAGLPADLGPEAAAAVVEDLRDSAPTYGGCVVVLTAPTAVRHVLDMWGPVPGLP